MSTTLTYRVGDNSFWFDSFVRRLCNCTRSEWLAGLLKRLAIISEIVASSKVAVQTVVQGIAVRAAGGPDPLGPGPRQVGCEPVPSHLGAGGQGLHPAGRRSGAQRPLHPAPSHTILFLGINFQPLGKKVVGHHIPLLLMTPSTITAARKLDGHHNGHLRDVQAQSPDVLLVDLLILREVLIIREEDELAIG
jgi:hypothetical protein